VWNQTLPPLYSTKIPKTDIRLRFVGLIQGFLGLIPKFVGLTRMFVGLMSHNKNGFHVEAVLRLNLR
jgi:hypothetical protein